MFEDGKLLGPGMSGGCLTSVSLWLLAAGFSYLGSMIDVLALHTLCK